MNDMSPADVYAMTRNNGGYGNDGFGFGNDGLWLFAILALMGGGFGNWNNRNGGNPVTEADLCNANNFTQQSNSIGRLSDQVDGVNINLTKAICDLGYTTLGNFNSLERLFSSCCCETQRLIEQVRFDGERNTSAIIQAQERGTQKVLDYLCGQENMRLRDENMRNYIQSQFCGVIRYPTQTAYTAGFNPYFGGWGCNRGGCCNNNI